jgi:hypothetical protein
MHADAEKKWKRERTTATSPTRSTADVVNVYTGAACDQSITLVLAQDHCPAMKCLLQYALDNAQQLLHPTIIPDF